MSDQMEEDDTDMLHEQVDAAIMAAAWSASAYERDSATHDPVLDFTHAFDGSASDDGTGHYGVDEDDPTQQALQRLLSEANSSAFDFSEHHQDELDPATAYSNLFSSAGLPDFGHFHQEEVLRGGLNGAPWG